MMWETGAVSTECLETLYTDIPVDLAIYAKENGLLEENGWKKLVRLANRSKLTERLVKQAEQKSFCISPQYKYALKSPTTLSMQRNWIRRMATQNGWIQTNWNTSNLRNMTYSLTKANLQDARYQEVSD